MIEQQELKAELFEMDATPAEISIYGNWFLTQGDVYWRNRYFYFRLKHSRASFTEYESAYWEQKQLQEIEEWGMEYPQDNVTSKEVAKLFWHLVVTKDPQYLEAHKKSVMEIRNKLIEKREQK
jgi:hypothetical protein